MFRLHSKILTLMILAMGFLLLTTMAYHIAHQKEAEQFNLAYKENLSRSIHNIILMKEHDLNKTTFDYCIWDEMVEFVHTADPAWAEENLNTLLTTLGCSYVAVFDETFRLVYSDCDSAGFGSRSFRLPVEQIKEAMRDKKICHYYFHTRAGLLEVSGSPVVPSADLERKSRPRGYFVTGRLWTGKFLKEMEEITNTGIKINSVTDTAINQAIEDPDEQNSIVIRTFLKDYRNQNSARLDFISKTQYKQNQNLFLYFTLIPLIISVILGFVFYFIIRAWIMVPLKLLTNSLDLEHLEPLEKISPRNKEFHAIGSMMIAFFEAKKKLEFEVKERKLAEERILKLSTAIEQSFSTIIITDPDGNVEYASKRFFELTGYNRSEIIGKNPRILQSGHHDTDFYQHLWKKIQDGKIWKGEFLNKKKNGSLFWEAATITPIKNLDGQIINYLAVKEDITEQKDAREKLAQYSEDLKESNISKDKFFSILAHDLKAPFHSILGYSELLATEYDTMTDADRRKFIQILRSSTKNVYDLVENLLQWSRLQTGRLTSVPEVFDLASEVEYSSDIFRAVAFKKNIRFDAGVTLGNLVLADRNMVRSILQNLISNALKFTPGGGSVAISAELRNKEMQVSIQDSGVGMDASELEKLFRIEFSFSKRGTAMESGTGLGLILCKELIVMNKGRIWAESQPGKGSTFRFTLPSATA